MIYITNELMKEYKEKIDKSFLKLLNKNKNNDNFTTQKWLEESQSKRFVYYLMYDKLLNCRNKKILDIGGGYCTFTEILNENHNYYLVDPLYHDDCNEVVLKNFHPVDWYSFLNAKEMCHFDYIIANDIFPNVDQRLELFLELFHTKCDKMILSLTYYNNPKYYVCKRVNADEYLTLYQYNGEHLNLSLKKWKDNIVEPNLDKLLTFSDSIFNNGRQVVVVEFNFT
jgi:hypothetical protein